MLIFCLQAVDLSSTSNRIRFEKGKTLEGTDELVQV